LKHSADQVYSDPKKLPIFFEKLLKKAVPRVYRMNKPWDQMSPIEKNRARAISLKTIKETNPDFEIYPKWLDEGETPPNLNTLGKKPKRKLRKQVFNLNCPNDLKNSTSVTHFYQKLLHSKRPILAQTNGLGPIGISLMRVLKKVYFFN
jgi:hypothetical protein